MKQINYYAFLLSTFTSALLGGLAFIVQPWFVGFCIYTGLFAIYFAIRCGVDYGKK